MTKINIDKSYYRIIVALFIWRYERVIKRWKERYIMEYELVKEIYDTLTAGLDDIKHISQPSKTDSLKAELTLGKYLGLMWALKQYDLGEYMETEANTAEVRETLEDCVNNIYM